MTQIEALDDQLNELATVYAFCRNRRTQLRIGARSIGWGLLGASHVASELIVPAVRRQPSAQDDDSQAGAWVAAVFSHNERRARAFADANQIPMAAVNLTDLLDRPEIRCIYVSSHPRHRYPLIMAALNAGKHVLCEPPLALSAAEAQTLVAAAAHRSRVLAVNFTARANPAVRTLRRLIRDDHLGDLLSGSVSNFTLLPPPLQTWRLQPGGGGVIFDRTIHAIDLLRFLLSDEIGAVFATAGQASLAHSASAGAEEEVVGVAQLARRRILVQLHDAFFPGHRLSRIELEGTHQSATIEQWAPPHSSPTLTLHRQRRSTHLELPDYDPIWLTFYQFQLAVSQMGSALASGDDGVRALQVCEALHRSVKEQVLLEL